MSLLPPALPTPPPAEPTAVASNAAGINRLLGLLLVVESLLTAIWILAVCTFNGSAGAVAYAVVTIFGIIYPLHIIIAGFTIWARFKRGASSRLTSMVLVLPWATLPVPFLLNRLNGSGPLLDSPQKLTYAVLLLLGIALSLVLFQPRKSARLLPVFVLRNFALNLLLFLATVLLYLIPIGFLLFHAEALSQPRSGNQDGYLFAYGLGALAAYTLAAAIPASLVLGYSGLSLFQDEYSEHRKWRIAQLIASLPLVLSGGGMLLTMWLRTR